MNVLTSVAFHTQEENGHSAPGIENNALLQWCNRQRRQFREETLTIGEVELLKQVDFRF